MKLTCLLMSSLILFASCNGQVKTNTPANNLSTQTSTSKEQSKLIKNHFTNQYQETADNVHCRLGVSLRRFGRNLFHL